MNFPDPEPELEKAPYSTDLVPDPDSDPELEKAPDPAHLVPDPAHLVPDPDPLNFLDQAVKSHGSCGSGH